MGILCIYGQVCCSVQACAAASKAHNHVAGRRAGTVRRMCRRICVGVRASGTINNVEFAHVWRCVYLRVNVNGHVSSGGVRCTIQRTCAGDMSARLVSLCWTREGWTAGTPPSKPRAHACRIANCVVVRLSRRDIQIMRPRGLAALRPLSTRYSHWKCARYCRKCIRKNMRIVSPAPFRL